MMSELVEVSAASLTDVLAEVGASTVLELVGEPSLYVEAPGEVAKVCVGLGIGVDVTG